ncbi:interleukin-23 receptor [Erethizon dorsatum]
MNQVAIQSAMLITLYVLFHWCHGGITNINCSGNLWVEPATVFKMGMNISIFCQAASKNCQPRNLYLYKNGITERFHMSRVNRTTAGHWFRNFLEPRASVYCTAQCPGRLRETLVCGQDISSGYPPDVPQEVTCIIREYSGHMTCSWATGRLTHVDTEYAVRVKSLETGEEQWYLASSYVNISTEALPAGREYWVWVQAANALGTEESEPLQVHLDDIVIPSASVISRAETLNATPPKTIIHWESDTALEKVSCEVRYAAATNHTWRVKEFDTNFTYAHQSEFFLEPDIDYIFQVRCREAGKKYWQPWSAPFFHKTPDAAAGFSDREGWVGSVAPGLFGGQTEGKVTAKSGQPMQCLLLQTKLLLGAQEANGTPAVTVRDPQGGKFDPITYCKESRGDRPWFSSSVERSSLAVALALVSSQQGERVTSLSLPKILMPCSFVSAPQVTPKSLQRGARDSDSGPLVASVLKGHLASDRGQDVGLLSGMVFFAATLSIFSLIGIFNRSLRTGIKRKILLLIPGWLHEEIPNMENSTVVKMLQEKDEFVNNNSSEQALYVDPVITEIREVFLPEEHKPADYRKEMNSGAQDTKASAFAKSTVVYIPDLSTGYKPQSSSFLPGGNRLSSSDETDPSTPKPMVDSFDMGKNARCRKYPQFTFPVSSMNSLGNALILEELSLILSQGEGGPPDLPNSTEGESTMLFKNDCPSDTVPEQTFLPDEFVSCLRIMNDELPSINPYFPQNILESHFNGISLLEK